MRLHIEMQTQKNIEAGMQPDESRSAAQRQFGGVESIKEICREQRGASWIENLGQDVRYGARTLRKNPGFTALAAMTLALGIGATSTVFSLIQGVPLTPPPYHEPERLALILPMREDGRPRNGRNGSNNPRYLKASVPTDGPSIIWFFQKGASRLRGCG